VSSTLFWRRVRWDGRLLPFSFPVATFIERKVVRYLGRKGRLTKQCQSSPRYSYYYIYGCISDTTCVRSTLDGIKLRGVLSGLHFVTAYRCDNSIMCIDNKALASSLWLSVMVVNTPLHRQQPGRREVKAQGLSYGLCYVLVKLVIYTKMPWFFIQPTAASSYQEPFQRKGAGSLTFPLSFEGWLDAAFSFSRAFSRRRV